MKYVLALFAVAALSIPVNAGECFGPSCPSALAPRAPIVASAPAPTRGIIATVVSRVRHRIAAVQPAARPKLFARLRGCR